MSWQAYIDSLLGSGGLNQAAIIGMGGEVWAKSSNFDISADELKAIMTGFQRQELFQSGGVRVNGQKYIYLQSDEKQMQGKSGNCGCSIARGNKCLIVCTYGEGQQPGKARNVVESMADYLKENGY